MLHEREGSKAGEFPSQLAPRVRIAFHE